MTLAHVLDVYTRPVLIGVGLLAVAFGTGYLTSYAHRKHYIDWTVEREVERRYHQMQHEIDRLTLERDKEKEKAVMASIALRACAVQVTELSELTDHEVKVVMVDGPGRNGK